MNTRYQYLIAFAMILAASLSRLLPHPPNFAPIAALALFGGTYFDKKFATIVPLAAMLVSDYFIGFHSMMVWVYGSFFAISFIGIWLHHHKSTRNVVGGTLAGSILFFVMTNFGVWVGGYYPFTLEGFVTCYVAAIPFFRNTLAGDFFYVAVLFGMYEVVLRFVSQRSAVKI